MYPRTTTLQHTVMRIIKLNLFPVPVRYRSIEMSSFSHHVLLYLRTLYIDWSLVRRRITRRLTRFQTTAIQYCCDSTEIMLKRRYTPKQTHLINQMIYTTGCWMVVKDGGWPRSNCRTYTYVLRLVISIESHFKRICLTMSFIFA